MNIRKMYKNCKLLFHWANLFDRFRFRNKKTSSQRNLIIVRNLSCFFNGRPYSSCRVGVFFGGGGCSYYPLLFSGEFHRYVAWPPVVTGILKSDLIVFVVVVVVLHESSYWKCIGHILHSNIYVYNENNIYFCC